MVCLVFGLLVSNIVLSSLVVFTWHSRTVEITPFSGSPGYLKSASHVDSYYLSLMAENFINERLNVSPETVDANHKRLLSFVNSKSYTTFLRKLNNEARIIKSKKMSSSFDITQIKTNPNQLTALVTGILKRYVGLQLIKEERVSYFLTFQYAYSRLSLVKFVLVKEREDA